MILIDQLKEIYIDGELEPIDTAQWYPEGACARTTRSALNLTGTVVDDPDRDVYENYACGAERNYTGYCNPEIDKLIDQQSMRSRTRRSASSSSGRSSGKLAEDGARPMHLLHRGGTCWRPHVKGLTIDGQQHLQRLAHGRRLARQIAGPWRSRIRERPRCGSRASVKARPRQSSAAPQGGRRWAPIWCGASA